MTITFKELNVDTCPKCSCDMDLYQYTQRGLDIAACCGCGYRVVFNAKCEVCFEPFTWAEWEERHSTPDGEDCHEHCCPDCLEELTETLSPQERNPDFRSW